MIILMKSEQLIERARDYWGSNLPIPAGARFVGIVRNTESKEHGALIRLIEGIYVQGNSGTVKALPRQQALHG